MDAMLKAYRHQESKMIDFDENRTEIGGSGRWNMSADKDGDVI